MKVNLAEFLRYSSVNGPGLRAVLWVQGCPLRCDGCFNEPFQNFSGGRRIDYKELVNRILGIEGISGITFTGGEPFSQADALAAIGEEIREEGLTVVTFTGFSHRFIQEKERSSWNRLLGATDLLVAGPYLQHLPPGPPLLGSVNQELHFLSGRILPQDVISIGEKPLVEFRIEPDGNVVMTGFPEPGIRKPGPEPA